MTCSLMGLSLVAMVGDAVQSGCRRAIHHGGTEAAVYSFASP
jgi:hypothetical protein